MGFVSGTLKVAAGIFLAGVVATKCTEVVVDKATSPNPDKTTETRKSVPPPQAGSAPQSGSNEYYRAGERTGELLIQGIDNAKEFFNGATSQRPSTSGAPASSVQPGNSQKLENICLSTEQVKCP